MKFINFAIVKFSICITLGILTAAFFPPLGAGFLAIITPMTIGLLLFWLIGRKQIRPTVFFGILTYCSFFTLGHYNYLLRLPKEIDHHYTHSISQTDPPKVLQINIREVLKPDRYHDKYIGTLTKVNAESTTGQVLISVQKDSTEAIWSIDQIIVVKTKLSSVNSPLNPGQFDYANYMKQLGVYGQIRIDHSDILASIQGQSSLRGIAEHIRGIAIKKIKENKLGEDERAIIQALILGQRHDISKALYASYAAAGAVHILAVSGLHVGIIYMLLLFLLKPLSRSRYGIIIQSMIVVLLLWGFAFVTGLSPSVTRAVTMFTLFAFAQVLNRRTSTINTLFLSYFILLLVNPLWLFHVGFQLSYLAVFSILWVQPKLASYYRPKTRLIRLFWGICTVTIAAQLGIIPLSLYYFHQFPGLFFITNLAILPLLGILLGGGIIIVCLAVCNVLPDSVAELYNHAITYLNQFITWIANQDFFLISNIPFSASNAMASYLFLASLIGYWKKTTYHRLLICFCASAVLGASFWWERNSTTTNEMVIFHKSKQSILAYKNNRYLSVFTTDSVSSPTEFPLQSYCVQNRITEITESNLPSVFTYNNKIMVVVDSLSVYPMQINPEWVVLIQSPKINLQRLLDSLQPNYIIADGSNYTSYVKRWEATCRKNKTPFHHTGSKGAFIIE